MKTRFITGFVMAAVLIPLLIFANEIVFICAAGVFSLVAIWEMLEMYEKKDANLEEKTKLPFLTKVVVYTLTMFVHLSITISWYFFRHVEGFNNLGSIFGCVLFISMLVIGLLLVFDKNVNSNYAGRILMIVNYAGLGFASLAILRMYSKGLLIYVVLIACFTDIFAYLFGVKFGKHKMAKVISPKKSWEGSIAGTVFGATFGAIFFIFYNEWFSNGGTLFKNICLINNKGLEIVLAILLSIGVSIIGQIGDLVASKQKRDYGIKDYGKVFPGHGGVLDRFDSTIFIGIFVTVICLFLGILLPL